MNETVNTSTKQAPRESNFELLRVLAMILIILGHWYGLSGVADEFKLGIGTYFVFYMHRISNVVFILITAWFMNTRLWSSKRFLSCWLQTFFYTFGFGLVGYKLGGGGALELIKCTFPITGSPIWYASVYMQFLLLVPFVGCMVRNIGRQVFSKMLALATIITVLLPTFLPITHQFASKKAGNWFNVWIFIYIYLVVTYFQKFLNLNDSAVPPYNIENKSIVEKRFNRAKNVIEELAIKLLTNMRYGFGLFTINYLIVCVVTVVLNDFLPESEAGIELSSWYWNEYNTLFAMLCAAGLFITFKNIRIPQNNAINHLGKVVFAVYLFHSNPLTSNLIWDLIGRIQQMLGIYGIFWFRAFTAVVILFMVALIIEIIRRKLEKLIFETAIMKKVVGFLDRFYDFAKSYGIS